MQGRGWGCSSRTVQWRGGAVAAGLQWRGGAIAAGLCSGGGGAVAVRLCFAVEGVGL